MKPCGIILLAFLLASCATQPKVDRNRDWAPFVGNYTFEQAVAELGAPYITGQQSDGTRFGEWVLSRSPQMSFGFGMGTGSWGSHGGAGVGVGTSVSPPPRGEYLRLDFGTNGMLQAWAKTQH